MLWWFEWFPSGLRRRQIASSEFSSRFAQAEPSALDGSCRAMDSSDDQEIDWHRRQIAENRALIDKLEASNAAGGDIFPETQAEIDRLKAQLQQSELIVAAYEKGVA